MKKLSKEKEKNSKIRNVIAEIQRVDQETADLRTVVKEAQKIDKMMSESKKKEIIISCRLLFTSVFDKIFIALLAIIFIFFSWINLKGNIFLGTYDYWDRIIREMGLFIIIAILYFIFNWIYHCINKTILCLTKNGIYKESYFPLVRREAFIPLTHVSSVTAINFCVLFRMLIIYQNNHLPVVFYTWDNRKFKRKVEELLGDSGKLKNIYENKNIINSEHNNIIKWFFIAFALVLIFVGFVNAIGYLFSPESRIVGTYTSNKERITLKSNGTCSLKLNGISKLRKCSWSFNKEYSQVVVHYEYDKENDSGKVKTTKDSFTAPCGNRLILYKGVQFIRE